MDESAAVDSLRRLGLSKYEAQVFIALQKLGTGTASEVNDIADVPRSQVYGAAEGLESHGLIEIQQSTPIQYRAVDLEEAKDRLRARLDREQDRAFDFLESVQGELGGSEEEREDIWTLHGSGKISNRVRQLVADADERVVFGTGNDLLTDDVVGELTARASAGVDVTVVSAEPPVVDRFEDASAVGAFVLPSKLVREDWEGGRILLVDDDTVLLSVFGRNAGGTQEETAIWSSGTGFAAVLGQLVAGWFGEVLAA